MKKGGIVLVILLIGTIVIFNLNNQQKFFSPESFSVGNKSHELVESYAPTKNISGWINISFVSQDGNELLRDFPGNSIQLIKLLKNQTDYDYSCIPSSCDNAYDSSSPNITKNFSLNTGEEKLIGFKINGEITEVTFSGFQINSDAGEDCSNQIKLDFLNDGSYEKGNTNSGAGACDFLRSYGCYNNSKTPSILNLEETPYCQRITLTESPGFKLGAWVKKSGADSTIIMSIKDLYGELIEGTSCTLPVASTSESEIFCTNNFLITKPQDYYVCIESEGLTNYTIKGYDDSNGCGFYGDYLENEGASYKLFAEGRKFGEVGTLSIDNLLPNENTLSVIIEDYLKENYPDDSCSSNCIADCSSGCIIPIRIKSGKSQNLNLTDLNLRYRTATGSISESNFYNLEESPVKINSGFGKLKLDSAGFSVPQIYGNYTFNLYLGSENILTQKVTVEKVPEILGLKPTLTVSALPTKFEISFNSSSTIQKYYWKFGDNQDQITSSPKVVHMYNSTGTYNLEIELTDNLGKSSSRTFVVTVLNPKSAIRTFLDRKKQDLNKIKTEINSMGEFYIRALNTVLETETIDNKLKNLEQRYVSSTREDQYNQIMAELFPINVPSGIEVSKRGENISFYSKSNIIDLDVLGEIEQASSISGKEEEYKNAILEWEQENLDVKISFEEISAVYEDETRPVGTFFTTLINKKTNPTYNIYFVLKSLNGLTFKENYLEAENSGYKFIELKQPAKEIGFFTSEDILFDELPLFISPGLDRLSVIDVQITKEPIKIKWAVLSLVLILVFIIGLVVYIVLQEWYRKKYEEYLFRDQTKLYNLVYYIDSSKRKGLSESDISKKLSNSGWNGEQISYALKKHAGKRTGMFEIPINRILNRLRKKGTDIPTKEEREQPSQLIPPKSVVPQGIRPTRPLPRVMQRREITSQNMQKNRKMFFEK